MSSQDAIRVVEILTARDHRRRTDGAMFASGKSASASDTVSTTNTATFVDAMVWQWTELPDGLYVVSLDASLLLAHSAAGQVSMRTVCNGVLGIDYNPQAPNESPATMPFRILQSFTEVEAANGAGIAIEVEFKGLDAGTTRARNPAIGATAVRVG